MTDALLALLDHGPAAIYQLADYLERPVDVVHGWLRALEREGKVRSEQLGEPPVLHWTRAT